MWHESANIRIFGCFCNEWRQLNLKNLIKYCKANFFKLHSVCFGQLIKKPFLSYFHWLTCKQNTHVLITVIFEGYKIHSHMYLYGKFYSMDTYLLQKDSLVPMIPSFTQSLPPHLCDVNTWLRPLVSVLRRYDCNTDTSVMQTLGSITLVSVSGGLTAKQTPL